MGPRATQAECVSPLSPELLSETCLFADLATRTIASDVTPFEVAYPLWSDAADKRRWIRLPQAAQIDTSDLNHWRFPVGTQVWKEFARDGVIFETRLIQRVSEDDYWMGAFLWHADGSDAIFVPDGHDDVHGTTHDVPDQEACGTCHDGEPGRILGFSATQLSGPAAVTLEALVAGGMLSHPPARGRAFPPPGDVRTQAALGYLHANCGHCHNPNGIAYGSGSRCPGCGERVDMILQLSTDASDGTPQGTDAYRTAVGERTRAMTSRSVLRVAPGDPLQSELVDRMRARSGDGGAPDPWRRNQMPPLATEEIDPAGLAAVSAWIEALR